MLNEGMKEREHRRMVETQKIRNNESPDTLKK